MTVRRTLTALACALALAGCAAGPDYKKPQVDMPAAWTPQAPWRPMQPQDAAARGAWWERFGDAQLNALQAQALAGNQTLAIAAARLSQARAQLNVASAGQYPQVGINARAARQRISANRPLTNYNSPNYATVQNDFALGLNVSYELDLFGRVQRSVEGAAASAQQSAADLENTRLLLTAELASNYFNLRALDIELDVVVRAIALQRRALELATARHDLGATSGLDVAQQQALLDSTLTQVDILGKQRAQYQHAIATLTGAPAPGFSIAPSTAAIAFPDIPLGVPSDLLERRPDIASAERAMAAANAQIGVASAAFYPSFMLQPAYGVDSRNWGALFNAPSMLWSLGVSATQSLFDAGRLRAGVDFTQAGYEAAVAAYRRTVLTAMQEVEDGITGIASLDRAYRQSQAAIASARRVLELANSRYDGGVTPYLDVITAQQALLNSERQAAQLMGQRLLVSVFLFKALGGDWPARHDEAFPPQARAASPVADK
ncbi:MULTISPECIES: efflux transporter outer membrane subunit [unclassified Herbaspirillum]|uniref:efflux transporter outer membrane subunit n=1 Tax=unclassified Herbaspirillum TaxID=2624150 RepID=UPI0011525930|nr:MULTISPECIES: efflux transporter outer membrane subunit [unclassified Herbaspirillum]MBB5389974.1 NodT family efflux transporter outer membrane factor (OMF) lipoprotein [Herbaspirillum sp. SJZ102]TQK09518.1 NodT family efflux transporter outer membrane factor (OMF) lipoprotein [Herbaspirillum sp. SJZ130]TQK13795.1 NodT family efflux transporter outer membrane factor (OMF) lipoprotein [Herbaspirillum sp. SJZ106]